MNREDIQDVGFEFASQIVSEIEDLLGAHEGSYVVCETKIVLDVDDSLSQFDGDLTSSNQTRLFLTAVSNELRNHLQSRATVTRRGTRFFIKMNNE